MQSKIIHSGNIGDIIYSLPAMKAVFDKTGKPIQVILRTNVLAEYANNPNFKHPSGLVQLTTKGAEMLKPLLLNLPFVDSVVITDEAIKADYDFDKFRQIGLRYQGSISRWYFYVFPELTCDLSQPLQFTINSKFTSRIVINRSERYNNPSFDYRILLPYQHMMTFIGLPREYELLQRKLPALKYHEVADFAEMAAVILGSELFIGNQSMAYSIAEIAGQNRILEVCPTAHNCIPMTPNGKDCINMQNMIWHIRNQYPKHEQLIKERNSIATDEQLR